MCLYYTQAGERHGCFFPNSHSDLFILLLVSRHKKEDDERERVDKGGEIFTILLLLITVTLLLGLNIISLTKTQTTLCCDRSHQYKENGPSIFLSAVSVCLSVSLSSASQSFCLLEHFL